MTVTLDPLRWKALALLGAAFFMGVLNATVVLTALPSIQAELALTGTSTGWVVTAYAVAFSGLLLFCGRAADLLGRRRVFMVGVGLFGLSSMLCALAWSGGSLIAARALHGASGAVIAPAALSILMTTFPEGPERNKALGVWGALGGVGATAGLLLGGAMVEALGWRSVFFVNVPVAMGMLALAPVLLRPSRDHEGRRELDAAGATTITATVVLVVFGIVQVPTAGWGGTRTVGPLAVAAGLAALFVAIERRSPAPLVPLRLLRSRTLVGGTVVILSAGMCVDGLLITLTSYTQQVGGWSAAQFGLLAAIMTVASVVGAAAWQHVVTRVGARRVAATGMVLLATAFALLTRVSHDGSSLTLPAVALIVFGGGMSASFVAAQIAALGGVRQRDSGLAAGIVDTGFSIGTALGIAICSSIAVAHADTLAVEPGGTVGATLDPTQGYRAAFAAGIAFAALGLATAAGLLGRRAGDPQRTDGLSGARVRPPRSLMPARSGSPPRHIVDADGTTTRTRNGPR